jgi:hypothetical protein
MTTITFRAKIKTVYNVDGTIAWQQIKVPKLTHAHCDMHAMRSHKHYGSYANSTLFSGLLQNIGKAISDHYSCIRLHSLPESVTVDASGFLAKVSIDALHPSVNRFKDRK